MREYVTAILSDGPLSNQEIRIKLVAARVGSTSTHWKALDETLQTLAQLDGSGRFRLAPQQPQHFATPREEEQDELVERAQGMFLPAPRQPRREGSYPQPPQPPQQPQPQLQPQKQQLQQPLQVQAYAAPLSRSQSDADPFNDHLEADAHEHVLEDALSSPLPNGGQATLDAPASKKRRHASTDPFEIPAQIPAQFPSSEFPAQFPDAAEPEQFPEASRDLGMEPSSQLAHMHSAVGPQLHGVSIDWRGVPFESAREHLLRVPPSEILDVRAYSAAREIFDGKLARCTLLRADLQRQRSDFHLLLDESWEADAEARERECARAAAAITCDAVEVCVLHGQLELERAELVRFIQSAKFR